MATLISKKTARTFLLFKQFLLPSKQFNGKEKIDFVLKTLRSVQYDPLNPCGRNVDLFFQARIDNIHPSDYYHWLYAERKGIETYDKELCVVPIEDLPLCRKLYSPSHKRELTQFMKNYKRSLNQLLKYIEKNGPICSKDINDNRKVINSWQTGKVRWANIALDTLWKMGKLVISHRKKGTKYYDLPIKIYGDKFIWNYDSKELFSKQIIRRLQSVGMLSTSRMWQGIGNKKEISPFISDLISKKALKEIKIEGSKDNYVVTSKEWDHFSNVSDIGDIEKEMTFLPPLDNLLWDRKMINDIFDFNYKWEVYTPKKLRKFGHYVLPILYGDMFIGRIEPKLQKKYLEIKGFWLEPGFFWSRDANNAFQRCINAFKNYLNVENVKWLCKNPLL